MTRHIGDSVTIDAKRVALIWRFSDVRELRQRNQGRDPELDRILDDLAFIAARYTRSVVNATLTDAGIPVAVDSVHEVTVAEAAKALSVTPQAVRKAIAEERLPARQIGRQWFITQLDLAEFLSTKDHPDDL